MNIETKFKIQGIVYTVMSLGISVYGIISGSVPIIIFGIASVLYCSFIVGMIYGSERMLEIIKKIEKEGKQ